MNTATYNAALTLALGAGLLSGAANANTIQALDSKPAAEVTCNGTFEMACQGFYLDLGTPATLDWALATAYPFQGNPTNELGYLNLLLKDIGEAAVSYVDKTDAPGKGFTTSREYFSIKKSTSLWYFRNVSGGAVEVSWSGEDYSHWTEYGDEAVDVPEPSPLALLAMGCAGLVLTRRRQRS